MKIPVREDYGQTTNVPNLPIPQSQPLPQRAFDTGAAISRAGESLQNLAATLSEIEARRKKEEREKVALQADDQFRRKLKETKTDLLGRSLDNATGISQEFDALSQQTSKEILESIQDPVAKASAQRLFMNTEEPIRSAVIDHESAQGRESYRLANESAVENAVVDAGEWTTPDELINSVGKAVAINTNYLTSSGNPPEKIELENRKLTRRAIAEALGNRVDSDPEGARAALDAIRGQVDPAVAALVDKTIAGKMFQVERTELWNQLAPGAQQEDGSVDYNAVVSALDNVPGMTDVKKDKLAVYFRAKVGESNFAARMGRAKRKGALVEAVLKAKQSGTSLDEAMRLVGPNSIGAQEILSNDAYVRRQYSNAGVKTDNDKFMELYQDIRDAKITDAEVEKAADQGFLSANDEKRLRMMYVNGITAPQTNAGFKSALQQLEEPARRAFGNNKKKKAEFLYDLTASIEETGGTADDLLDKGLKSLQKVKPDNWFSKERNFQESAGRRRAASALIGSLNAAPGLTRGRVRDYEDDIAALNMDEAPAAGSPEYQAIQGIIQRGLALNQQTIATAADRIRKQQKGAR